MDSFIHNSVVIDKKKSFHKLNVQWEAWKNCVSKKGPDGRTDARETMTLILSCPNDIQGKGREEIAETRATVVPSSIHIYVSIW